MTKLKVEANKESVDTSIDVSENEIIQVQASGKASYHGDKLHGPEGAGFTYEKCLFPDIAVGALVCWVAPVNDQFKEGYKKDAFVVKTYAQTVTVVRGGRLYFAFNDQPGKEMHADNSGQFEVTVDKVDPKKPNAITHTVRPNVGITSLEFKFTSIDDHVDIKKNGVTKKTFQTTFATRAETDPKHEAKIYELTDFVLGTDQIEIVATDVHGGHFALIGTLTIKYDDNQTKVAAEWNIPTTKVFPKGRTFVNQVILVEAS